MISYTSADGRKVESVRVAVSGLALRATGYIVSAQDPAYGASYSVVVDAEGRTRRITVRCDDVSGERSLSLTRSRGGPWIVESVAGSSPLPALAEAVDAFISDSAFSVSLPVRRLAMHRTAGAEAEITVASISLPDLTVTPQVHHGRTESVSDDGALIAYSGQNRERTVVVDDDGLFVRAEGLSERVG
jgi:hypothetical protein